MAPLTNHEVLAHCLADTPPELVAAREAATVTNIAAYRQTTAGGKR
jgi:hypothetical protein